MDISSCSSKTSRSYSSTSSKGLEDAGAGVRAAQTVEEAFELLRVHPITASVLDFKLGGGTADDLCHELTARKIPFVIYSGYKDVEGDCNKWEIVHKPADTRDLVARVLKVLVENALPDPCPGNASPQADSKADADMS